MKNKKNEKQKKWKGTPRYSFSTFYLSDWLIHEFESVQFIEEYRDAMNLVVHGNPLQRTC